MPWKSKAQTRICKWCESPAKRYVTAEGRFKGYATTCGSDVCLKAAYHDNAVIARKAWQGTKVCEKCSAEYPSKSRTQRWCSTCSPDKRASTLLLRYNLSAPEYTAMLTEQNGLCLICEGQPALYVDHDHTTGRVRGLLCPGCNTALSKVEDEQWLKKARIYVTVA